MGRRRVAAAVALSVGLVGCGGGRSTAPPLPSTVPIPAVTATTAAMATTTASSAPPVPPTTTVATTTVPTGPPYPVGETTLALVDTSRPTVSHGRLVSRSRALTTVVWYPRVAGRRPLVVFAPGYEVGPPPYTTLLEAWAAHGYVVAAIEFPLTDTAVAGANLDENDIANQPADVRFVTDSLVAAGPLAGRIETTRVAVAGHSDGAETTLAESVTPTPPGAPAYRAVIAMSVQPLTGVSHTANPPILVTQGDADNINPPSYGYQTWAEAASPRYLVVLHGGGHLPPLEAGSAWLSGIEATTEAFLDCFLSGKVPASAIPAALAGSTRFGLQVG